MHVTYIKVGTVQLVGLKWRTLIKLLQYIQTGLLLELEINQSQPVVKSYVCVTYTIVKNRLLECCGLEKSCTAIKINNKTEAKHECNTQITHHGEKVISVNQETIRKPLLSSFLLTKKTIPAEGCLK